MQRSFLFKKKSHLHVPVRQCKMIPAHSICVTQRPVCVHAKDGNRNTDGTETGIPYK